MTGLPAEPNILVLGGDSRLGRVIRRDPTLQTRALVRRAPRSTDEYATTDYASIPVAALKRTAAVINCVGTSQATDEELWRINAEIPLAAAAQAKAAGVPRFVQISSFSVYGGNEKIGRTTPVAPSSIYGRAKAHADEKLAALADANFTVISLRLPAIVDVSGGDKLNSLICLWQRIRRFPVPRSPVLRSMIGVDLAAVAVRCSLGTAGGIIHAADPAPFEYQRAARFISDSIGRRVDCVRVPAQLIRMLAMAMPAVHDSLYRDSLLDASDNMMAADPGCSTLYDLIAAIARNANMPQDPA